MDPPDTPPVTDPRSGDAPALLVQGAAPLLELVLAAQPAGVPEHVSAIEAALPVALHGDDVCAALAEALGNAIIHGALGVSYQRRAAGDLEATLDEIDEAARRLGDRLSIAVEVFTDGTSAEIVITDPGPGFDWRADPTSGGLGLTILRSVFDAVRWNGRGNVVSLLLAPSR